MNRFIFLSCFFFFLSYFLIESKQEEEFFDNETFFVEKTTSIEDLHSKYNNILNNKNLKNFSVSVYSIDKKHYYYEKNSYMPLTPASLTKLFTTYNTIKTLGDDFKYSTQVYIDGIIRKDTLFGNLIIRGSGDPLININDIEYLAEHIQRIGFKFIKGDIIADGRVFEKEFQRINYSGDADVVEPTPPISGLALERNTVTVLVTSGGSGNNARVQCYPNSDYFKIINNTNISNSKSNKKTTKKKAVPSKKQVKPKAKKKAALNEEINYKNYFGDELRKKRRAARPSISISTRNNPSGFQDIIVSGRISPRSSYSYQYFINNPNICFAATLLKRLQTYKINISGTFRETTDNELIMYDSKIKIAELNRDIWNVISLINKNSDNYLAESLFKLYTKNISDKSSKKLKEIKDSISKHLFINCNECLLNDGSGLSRRNLLTNKSLTNLLINSYNSEFNQKFIDALSIGGVDGTLRKRFRTNNSYNNIKAKTGTLRNASGLAGYATTLDGEKLIFCFMFNGNDVGYYKGLENQLAEILTSFTLKK